MTFKPSTEQTLRDEIARLRALLDTPSDLPVLDQADARLGIAAIVEASDDAILSKVLPCTEN